MCFQPQVTREFVHRSERDVRAALDACSLRVLDTGQDTQGRTTRWLLVRRA